jgi:cytidylate kinase
MIIAVDGPAASGKGTLGKRIAAHYGLNHLDTGLLYRAVARALLDQGKALTDEAAAVTVALGLDFHSLDEARLRGAEAGEAASVISVYPGVREALLQGQREFAAQAPGAVLDGRDIGTVICPDADAKLFVTASPEERAKRRWLELQKIDPALTYDTVLADVRKRDERDSSRAAAPLKMADNARLLDTTKLGIEAAFQAALGLIEAELAGKDLR